MHFSRITFIVLAILLFGSTLLLGRFSSATDNPSILTSVDKEASSPTSAPTCINLTKVQGPVVTFGFEGKSPYSVEIDAKGDITAKGLRNLQELPPVPFPFGFERTHISPSTVEALVRLASANDFWNLPSVVGGNSSSDSAPMFMTVNLSCTSHRVVVRDDSKTGPDVQRFAEVFTLLSDLVYNQPVGYKPLQ